MHAFFHSVIPACPSASGSWQYPGIGVQAHLIVLIRESAQQRSFLFLRLSHQRQTGIRVRGENHLIENLTVSPAKKKLDALTRAQNLRHGTIQAKSRSERLRNLLNVVPRTPCHGTPNRTVADLQHRVVSQKFQHKAHRKIPKGARIARPERASQWQQIPIHQDITVAVLLCKIAHRNLVRKPPFKTLDPVTVKTQDILQQAPTLGTQQITPLGEKGIQIGSAEFEAGHVTTHAETHIRCLRFDIERIEQCAQ